MTQSKHPEYANLQSQLGEITEALVKNGLMKRNINTSIDYLIEVAKNHDHFTKLLTDLRTQRDALYERLTQVVDVTGEPTLEELVEQVITRSSDVVLHEGTRQALCQIAALCDKQFGVDIGYETLPEAVEQIARERNKAVTTLEQAGYTDNGGELWKPPLGETPERFKPRYIVHGDIKPCVVLYSDETTTLVRLDETDMMCETSTIEWSDELTYRCQEMLKSEGRKDAVFVKHATPVLAQLVRDERILLNDGGSDYAGNEWTSTSSPTPLR